MSIPSLDLTDAQRAEAYHAMYLSERAAHEVTQRRSAAVITQLTKSERTAQECASDLRVRWAECYDLRLTAEDGLHAALQELRTERCHKWVAIAVIALLASLLLFTGAVL
jgi:hypothetical protein